MVMRADRREFLAASVGGIVRRRRKRFADRLSRVVPTVRRNPGRTQDED
jgi:hypothetical protein